jgi:predicted negative regulator of RcsB-dependent stress response
MNVADQRQNKEKQMENIRQWYLHNYTEITWFLIGFLTLAGFHDLSVGNYTGALVDFGLAYVNYFFSKR